MSESADKEKISSRLEAVISAVTERIHYAEQRRSNFSSIGGVFVATGFALLTFAFSKIDLLAVKYGFIATGFSVFVVGTIVLYAYARQTNRYPWTSATKTWKWFYRDALPEEKKFTPKWWSYFRFGGEKKRIQQEYARQLEPFQKSIERVGNGEENFRQDVEQLYVLHVNEKYKNLHLSDLRKITERGLVATIAIAAAAVVAGYSCDVWRAQPKVLAISAGAMKINGEWRRLACDENGNCDRLLLRVTLQNCSASEIALPTFTGIDDAGVEVPLQINGAASDLLKIPPHSSVKQLVVMSPVGLVRAPIRTLRLTQE